MAGDVTERRLAPQPIDPVRRERIAHQAGPVVLGARVGIGPIRDLVGDAVLRDRRAEPVGRPDQPVDHEPAVAQTQDAEAVRIGEPEARRRDRRPRGRHRRRRRPSRRAADGSSRGRTTWSRGCSAGSPGSPARRAARPRRAARAPTHRAARRGRRPPSGGACRRRPAGEATQVSIGPPGPGASSRRITGWVKRALPGGAECRPRRPGGPAGPVLVEGHQLHRPGSQRPEHGDRAVRGDRQRMAGRVRPGARLVARRRGRAGRSPSRSWDPGGSGPGASGRDR